MTNSEASTPRPAKHRQRLWHARATISWGSEKMIALTVVFRSSNDIGQGTVMDI